MVHPWTCTSLVVGYPSLYVYISVMVSDPSLYSTSVMVSCTSLYSTSVLVNCPALYIYIPDTVNCSSLYSTSVMVNCPSLHVYMSVMINCPSSYSTSVVVNCPSLYSTSVMVNCPSSCSTSVIVSCPSFYTYVSYRSTLRSVCDWQTANHVCWLIDTKSINLEERKEEGKKERNRACRSYLYQSTASKSFIWFINSLQSNDCCCHSVKCARHFILFESFSACSSL
jgi:hypothetical protein